jgi:hypothetical protein
LDGIKQIEKKHWLDYFDGAKEIDLNRFYDISFIVATAKTAGFNLRKKHIIDKHPHNMPIKEFIILIKSKAFSILHYISAASYATGLNRLIDDSRKKDYIKRHNAKTVLCFEKVTWSAR